MKTTHSDALTPQEIAAVLRAAGEGRHGVRDHAMLLTLYHHGLRVSELCRLTLPDLDLEGRRLWVERLNRGRSGAHPVPEDEAQALGVPAEAVAFYRVLSGLQALAEHVNVRLRQPLERARILRCAPVPAPQVPAWVW